MVSESWPSASELDPPELDQLVALALVVVRLAEELLTEARSGLAR